jgi:hypothetical protein
VVRTGYQIIDEPRSGPLSAVAVDPLWPFLALMFAGPWLGLPWFVVNALAIGSATQKKETLWVAAALAGQFALWGGLFWLVDEVDVGKIAVGYLRFIPIVWILGFGYVLHFSQTRSAQLFVYFGGRFRVGWPIAIAGGIYGRPFVAHALEQLPSFGLYLKLVLA